MSAHNIREFWYCVDNSGVAMLCCDEDDARRSAVELAEQYPHRRPYRAVLLGDVAAERAARIEAQRQVEQLQERIKRAAVETAKAVAAERERLRGYFREALADTGITWPGEVDILYDKCFGGAA